MNRWLFPAFVFLSASTPLVVDSALKGAVLMSAALLGTMLLWRASAAARHLVWLAAVLALLAVPLLSLVLPGWRVLPAWAVLPTMTAPAGLGKGKSHTPAGSRRPSLANPTTPQDFPSLAAHAEPSPKTPAPAVLPAALPSTAAVTVALSPPVPRWRTALPFFWSAGCTVLLLRLLGAHWLLRRAARRARFVTDGPLMVALAAAAAQLGVIQRVRLLVEEKRTIPVVWGVWRPRLMLPAEALTWDAGQLQSVLLHELAHIRRRDTLVQRLAARANTVEFAGSLPTAPLKFRVLPVDPAAAKTPRVVLGPGEYPLNGGTATSGAVTLKIVGRPLGDRRTNDAGLLFEATEATGKLRPDPHKLEIPDGWGTWAIVCRPGEGTFYLLEKGGVWKIDYTNPRQLPDSAYAKIGVPLAEPSWPMPPWGEEMDGLSAGIRVTGEARIGGEVKAENFLWRYRMAADGLKEESRYDLWLRGGSPLANVNLKALRKDGTEVGLEPSIVDVLSTIDEFTLQPREVAVMSLMSVGIGKHDANAKSAHGRSIGYWLPDKGTVTGFETQITFTGESSSYWSGSLAAGTPKSATQPKAGAKLDREMLEGGWEGEKDGAIVKVEFQWLSEHQQVRWEVKRPSSSIAAEMSVVVAPDGSSAELIFRKGLEFEATQGRVTPGEAGTLNLEIIPNPNVSDPGYPAVKGLVLKPKSAAAPPKTSQSANPSSRSSPTMPMRSQALAGEGMDRGSETPSFHLR